MGFFSGVHNWWRQRRVVYRSLENPNLPLNDPAAWETIFGDSATAYTGESITHEKALMYAPVWQAVSLISGDVAKLPLNLYRRANELGDDARVLASDDSRLALVRRMANEETDAFQLWRRAILQAVLWGNAYVFIDRNPAMEPIGLYNLLPDRTGLKNIEGTTYCVTEADGVNRVLLLSSVIHLRGPGDGMDGNDLVRFARNSIGLGLAQERFASTFFKSGGRVGGILELPAGMPKPARDTIEEGFRKMYEGAESPFKTVILRDNAKFHAAQTTPRDSQMIEGTEAEVRQIARWFNLAPSKLGLSDSVSYNSKAEDNQNYLDTTLSPWLLSITSQCNSKLLTEEEQSTMYFEHNTEKLLRLDAVKRFQIYQTGISARILSPNECRAKENMLPYEGGDVFANPNTSTNIAAVEEHEPSEPEPKKKEPVEEPKNRHAVKRFMFWLGDKARHRARQSAKSYLEWLDKGMEGVRTEAVAADAAELAEAVIAALQAVADTVTEESLASRVDEIATSFERDV